MSQTPAQRRPSWLERIRRRVLASFEQNTHSRSSTHPDMNPPDQSLVRYSSLSRQARDNITSGRALLSAFLMHMSRRPSTPIQRGRPNTAPTVPNPTPFRQLRWEFRTLAPRLVSPSDRQRTERCPYDPEGLHFFGSFEETRSICGLSPRRIWQGNRPVATPCQDCRQGTERAHINVSPSRFSRRRSNIPQRASVAHHYHDAPSRSVENVTPDQYDKRPRPAFDPRASWRRPVQNSISRNVHPPEYAEHTVHPEAQATYDQLRAIVERTRASSFRPRSPPPRLHRLSPDIAYIHRSEVAAHQAAIREGRHSPVLDFQARGASSIGVIGYELSHTIRDTSARVLYPENILPGEYIPPPPRPSPPPTYVRSHFRRRLIDISPVPQPVLMSRLNEPPFVPALPEGTTLRPFSEWRRPVSAPEPEWEGALRHSALYRTQGMDHRPRAPSPLRQQHRPGSFDSDWSHGTMPFDTDSGGGTGGRGKKLVNGVGKRPNIRGGGEERLETEVLLTEGTRLQQWSGCTSCQVSDGKGEFDISLPYSVYKIEVRGNQRFDACMELTTQMPRLRGGGGGGGGGKSDRGPIHVPSSLLYLAGSTRRKPGESTTVNEWNRMKPKRRMGGLLGMAVYGHKVGQPYIPLCRNQEVQTDPEHSTTTDPDVVVRDSAPTNGKDPMEQNSDSAAQGQASATGKKTSAPEENPESNADEAGSKASNSASKDDASNSAPPYPTTPSDDGGTGEGDGAANGANVQMPPVPEKSP